MKAGRMPVAVAGGGGAGGVCSRDEGRAAMWITRIEDITVLNRGFQFHSLSSFFEAIVCITSVEEPCSPLLQSEKLRLKG